MDVLRVIAATGPVPAGEGPTGPDIPWVLIVAAVSVVAGALAAWRRPTLRRPFVAIMSICVGVATALVILITDGWANSTTGSGTSMAAQAMAATSVATGFVVAGLAIRRRRGRSSKA
jgi:ABC-type branched-subunit amino acid transport system permease subunit